MSLPRDQLRSSPLRTGQQGDEPNCSGVDQRRHVTISYMTPWDASPAGQFILSGVLTGSKARVFTDSLARTSLTFALNPIAA